MQETEHYKLKKPAPTDFYNIENQNENADKLEAALDALETGKEGLVRGTAAKETPVDSDALALLDSTDGSNTKRVLWSRVKAVLRAWFDTLYSSIGHTHAWSSITGKPSSFAPSGHAASHRTGGMDALTPVDIGAEIAGAAEAVQTNLTTHAGDAVKHITSAERTTWNGKAAGSHTHAPTDLTTPVPIAKGGHAGTTAAQGRANLGALGTFGPVAVTIPLNWAGVAAPYTQNIAVSGVLAAWDWRLGLRLAKITDDAARKLQEKAFACITWCETYDGGITLTCRDKKPDVAISAVLAGEV